MHKYSQFKSQHSGIFFKLILQVSRSLIMKLYLKKQDWVLTTIR